MGLLVFYGFLREKVLEGGKVFQKVFCRVYTLALEERWGRRTLQKEGKEGFQILTLNKQKKEGLFINYIKKGKSKVKLFCKKNF